MNGYEQYAVEYNRRWQERIIRTCFVSATVIVIFEIAYYFIITVAGLRDQTSAEYIIKYILLPGAIIFLMCLIGKLLIRSEQYSSDLKSLIALMSMVVICGTAASVHNIFSATMFAFFVPLALSVVFGKKKITNLIGGACVIGECVAVFFASKDLRGEDAYFLLDCLMFFIVFGILWYTVLLLMANEHEKRSIMDSMHREKNTLEQKVCHDELTGLYNLLGLQLYAEGKMAEGKESYYNSSLAFLDVDNFKAVNDTFGHETGNQVLVNIAGTFCRHFPENSCIARYGGDEFVVLLPGVTPTDCKILVDQLLVQMADSPILALQGSAVALSCGVAHYDLCTPVLDAIKISDQAMYTAKAEGKNRTVVA